MSFFGLDLAQKGLSLYTVPAALTMAMLPNVYALALSGTNYDLCNPRKLQDNIATDDKLDKIAKARILRAKAASDNAFETLGFYSAAVVAANVAGVDAHIVNVLSLGYVGCRALYNIIYVRLQDNRNFGPLRSLAWMASIGISFMLYFKAAAQLASS
ncbi:membrane protein [Colletotrichum incanum]|uniref:Membrane protein n=1 Tax=Colletotrichum incanum TaxID=1573173 RepID=A0A162N651_COLIC|nr:membrane protein [Colletotrichum incanum]OHW93592.1 membrane protein [Colletotrichum incanum]